jgi:Ser/Thr protein kinase RdoA (MazF antagonist)
MKPYSELTRLGKIRRLRKVVLKALDDYDLRVEGVDFMTIETNTMFKIRTVDAEKFVMRIYSDEETTLRENRAEMFWLDALMRDSDIPVTEPVPRRDGEYISVVSVPGVPQESRCVLFRWVPGRVLEQSLSPDNYYKFGATLAGLHNHAQCLKPLPAWIQPKKWNKVFYYPDEPVVYNTQPYAHLFPPQRIALLDAVIVRADDLFGELFSNLDGQILIHGDLHFWNVHLHRGQLYVIDFEDIMLGYPLQDVAVTLSYGRDRDGYPDWKDAFQQGYSGIRAWPAAGKAQIETLIAARTVMFINYVARIDPQPEEYIQSRCVRLEWYLDTFG